MNEFVTIELVNRMKMKKNLIFACMIISACEGFQAFNYPVDLSLIVRKGLCLNRQSGMFSLSCKASGVDGAQMFRAAGPSTVAQHYDDSSLWDRLAIGIFRRGMVKSLGYDTETPGYAGLMELARGLNRKYKPVDAQAQVQLILRGLFPEFIIRLFPLMFSGPFPGFSAKLNSWITQASIKHDAMQTILSRHV